MEKRRLFVGSLPHEITEDVIKQRFSKYGDVVSIELKHRYGGLNENDIISTFAFVDVLASQDAISTCIKKLSRKKWLGKEVTVQFAKESVLSRLENERKINEKVNLNENKVEVLNKSLTVKQGNECNNNNKTYISEERLKNNSKVKKISLTASDDSSGILSKLEKFSNVWNDCDEFSGRTNVTKFDDSDFTVVPRDVFQSTNTKGDENANNLDSGNSISASKTKVFNNLHSKKIAVSEEKRLKSVEEMKKTIDQRKMLVKKALSSIDSVSLNKKIVFDDDDYDYSNALMLNGGKLKKPLVSSGNKLFNDDSGDEEEVQSFAIKQQFEGEKGKKLFQLQSKFGNDSRFSMDERFYESDREKNSDSCNESNTLVASDQEKDDNENVNDEVKKQLQILQTIVGDKDIMRPRKKLKPFKPDIEATGVRFDPSIREHEKFIVKPPENGKSGIVNEKSRKNKKVNENIVVNDEQEKDLPVKKQVSKGTFYEVADELKETFKSTEKSSFSFSDMFKSSSGEKDMNEKSKIEKSPFMKKNLQFNDFGDDRFGGDFSLEQEKLESLERNKNTVSKKHLVNLWNENFFYQRDDPRLEEAHNFFSRENFEFEDDFEGKRKELKKIIKKKVMNKVQSQRPFKKKIGISAKRRNFKRRKFQ